MAKEKNWDVLNSLESRRYNPLYEPPEDHATLKIGGKTVGSLNNFVVFSGLPKAGKTTYISALMASALAPNFPYFGIEVTLPVDRRRIAYFDTEASQFDHHRTMLKVRRQANFASHPERLDSFILRQDDHTVIKKYIVTYLQTVPECSLLIIDGLLDLVLNYNDEVECKQLIQFLKRITAEHNILVVCILHLGKKDKETLGHLGSATDRYAQATVTIEKDRKNKTYNMLPRFLRSDEDFEPIAIQNFGGAWHQVEYIEPEQFNFNSAKKTKQK
ncbi:MAG: AAA family ATPase [Candidatus Kapaibacterium sp.]